MQDGRGVGLDRDPVVAAELGEVQRRHDRGHRGAGRLMTAHLQPGGVGSHPVGVVNDRCGEPQHSLFDGGEHPEIGGALVRRSGADVRIGHVLLDEVVVRALGGARQGRDAQTGRGLTFGAGEAQAVRLYSDASRSSDGPAALSVARRRGLWTDSSRQGSDDPERRSLTRGGRASVPVLLLLELGTGLLAPRPT